MHGLLYTTDRNQGCSSYKQHNTGKIGTKATMINNKKDQTFQLAMNSHSRYNMLASSIQI